MLYERLLGRLFDRLWNTYRLRVPHAEKYCRLVAQRGGTIVNDHIAFRSFNTPDQPQPAGIRALADLFEALGYERREEYSFPQTHLTAVHLEHRNDALPKLFISQLEVDQLAIEAADAIREELADQSNQFVYPAELIRRLDFGAFSDAEINAAAEQLEAVFSRPWNPPKRSVVEQANLHSQYAAWTLLHGNAPNHFTALVNKQCVADWPDIESTMAGLRDSGVPVKDTIEGERNGLLRQSATHAVRGRFDVTEADGSPGKIDWTYAYYEIAERGYVTDESGGSRLFSGFFGQQTTGLFEMTRVS